MNILLVSDSFIIIEVLENLFKNLLNVEIIRTIKSLRGLKIEDISDIDFIFIDIKEDFLDKLNIISEAKKIFSSLKVIVLDLSKNKKICKKVIDVGIEGYIMNISDREEFMYIINKVIKGKKMYDPDLLQEILKDYGDKNIDTLTSREKEVLELVALGLNNRDIAGRLYITEYTVKKHVSNIFYKLSLKNRKEVIIYAREYMVQPVYYRE